MFRSGSALTAFGTDHTVTISPLINSTGSVGVGEVTSQLQSVIDSAPDSTTFIFPTNGRYRVEKTLAVTQRNRLIFVFNGSEIFATFDRPYAHVINDAIITGPAPGSNPPLWQVNSPTEPLTATDKYTPITSDHILQAARTNGIYADGPPQGRKDGWHQIGFARDTGTAPPLAIPGSGITVVIQGPNQGRCQFIVNGGSSIYFEGGIVSGSNENGGAGGLYALPLEDQHCVSVQGTDNFHAGNMTFRYPWGDFVCLAADAPHGNQCTNGSIHDCTMHTNGRQGVTVDSAVDFLITRNTISDLRRSCFDFEVPGGSTVRRVTISKNTISREHAGFSWINLSSYPAGAGGMDFGDVVIDGNFVNTGWGFNFAGSLDGTRRGPFTVTNNRPSPGTTVPVTGNAAGYAVTVDHCDGFLMTGNVTNLQAGRGMRIAQFTTSTGIEVHDNDYAAGIGEFTVVPYPFGQARFQSGSVLTADGHQTTPATAAVHFQSGSTFTADGHGVTKGRVTFQSGSVLTAKGSQVPVVHFQSGSVLTATAPPVVKDHHDGWDLGTPLRGPGWNEGWNVGSWNGFDE